ncbi:MAG TPA: hypothetical protein VGM33_15180 [Baekduia sp.]|jgi:hypothetical protein
MAVGSPDRVARWLRAAAGALAAVGVVVLGIVVLQADPPKLTAKTLSASVEQETGGASALQPTTCSREGPQAWTCVVADAGGSGVASYAVAVTAQRCWHARRHTAHPRAMPESASGCVR